MSEDITNLELGFNSTFQYRLHPSVPLAILDLYYRKKTQKLAGTLLGVVIIDPNSTVSPIDDPKLEGFVFDKWLDEEDNPFDFNTSLSKSIVLKASFKEELPDTGVESYWMWILGIGLGLGLISRKKQDSK